jgi:hypothetical protein
MRVPIPAGNHNLDLLLECLFNGWSHLMDVIGVEGQSISTFCPSIQPVVLQP